MAYTPRPRKDARGGTESSPPPAAQAASGPGAAPTEAAPPRPAGKQVVRRRRRRDNLLDPQAGWGLIGDAAGRLGLWEGLAGYLAQRAFALAVEKLVPQLAPHVRAERLAGDTLVVRVSSSAVASDLTYIRDLLLVHVNDQLRRLPLPGRRTVAAGRGRAATGPINRLQHRIGAVAELPDARQWSEVERRPPPPRPPRPRTRVQVDRQVAEALSQIGDEPLRRALGAMYAASLKEPDPG